MSWKWAKAESCFARCWQKVLGAGSNRFGHCAHPKNVVKVLHPNGRMNVQLEDDVGVGEGGRVVQVEEDCDLDEGAVVPPVALMYVSSHRNFFEETCFRSVVTNHTPVHHKEVHKDEVLDLCRRALVPMAGKAVVDDILEERQASPFDVIIIRR